SVQDDADKEMFDVDTLNNEEVFVTGQNENVVEEIVDAAQVSTAATTTTISSQGLSQDKGKGILVEPEKPLKKKDQLKLYEEIALKLQAEIDEEERIARAKEKKIDGANIAWDDIQAKVDADYQLAERLQVEEQDQTELVEGSSKRAGTVLLQESTKKQKVDEDKDTTKLQSLMEVILDEEEVAIDAYL
ncbi:hypothetical protein Tco_1551494, partial [Tanacetum coccineum]